MRIGRLLLLVVGSILVLSTTGFTEDDLTLAHLVNRYDIIERQAVDLSQWKSHNNDSGSLAWNTSYLLNSYLGMYEVSSDHKYLDRFVTLADAILDVTDKKRGMADYKGRKQTGWGSVAYSGDRARVVWLAHSGMITYPLLRFALDVKQHSIHSTYSHNAESYVKVSEAALKEFDNEWRYDSDSQEGHYVFEKDQPDYQSSAGAEVPVPFNMQLAAGRSFIVLWKLTHKTAYFAKARALAKHFKDHVQVDESGAYMWTYWYDRALSRSASSEDASHGAIDVDFAVLAAQNGIIFDKSDLNRFLGSFNERLALDRRESGGHLAATQAKQDPYPLARWLPLLQASCTGVNDLADEVMDDTGHADPLHLIALSQLAKYWQACHASLDRAPNTSLK